MFIAVVKSSDGKIDKYQDFDTFLGAQRHINSVYNTFPDAFVAEAPDGSFSDWLVDIAAKTLTYRADPERPMRDWKRQMAETDKDMPRWLEDHIENAHSGSAGNARQQTAYDNKKSMRLGNPELA